MEKEQRSTTWAEIILGIFLMTTSFIILVIFGSGWAKITRLGLGGEFIWVIILCLCGLVSGFLFICKEKLDILTLGSERGTPVWAGIIMSLSAIFSFIIGWLKNSILGYIMGILLTFVVINGVLARASRQYEELIWRAAGKIMYIVGVLALAIYFAFENVNLLYISLGILIAIGSLIIFTKYGKKIRKYTIFQEKYLVLIFIIVLTVIIWFTQMLLLS